MYFYDLSLNKKICAGIRRVSYVFSIIGVEVALCAQLVVGWTHGLFYCLPQCLPNVNMERKFLWKNNAIIYRLGSETLYARRKL